MSSDSSDKLALAVNGLDPESAQSLRSAFVAMFDQADEWIKRASDIRVTDVSQKREMKLARESRLALREIRTNAEHARKRLKEDSLRRGKAIDGIANVLKALIEPIEAHLLQQETFAERLEAEQRRAEETRAAEVQRVAQEAELAKKLEADRLERERADLERSERETAQRTENERLRREALERDKAARVERERIEAERTAERAAADERIRAERAAREAAESQARKERLEREAAEKAASEEKRRREQVEADRLLAQAPKPANVTSLTVVPTPAIRRHLTQRSEHGFLGITASAIDRTLECPAWTAFPRVYRTSEFADRGHGIHSYIRAVLSGTASEVALAAVDEAHRETCRMIDWQKLCGDLESLETEAAYAIHTATRTARFLGFNIGREYAKAAERQGEPLTEDDVCGSLDLAGLRKSDGRPTVRDVKSGFQDVEPAESNGQARFFAAVKALLTGASEVDSEIAKLKPNGDLWLDRATFTAWDVDEFLDELETAVARAKNAKRVYLAGGMPDVSESPSCEYCPSSDSCPAKTAYARAMLGDLTALDGSLESMSLESMGRAFEIAHDRAKPIIDRVIKVAKERARREPVPLSSGKELRPIEYDRNDLSSEAVVTLARSLGATDTQIRDCYRTSTVVQVRVLNAEGSAKRGRRSA